MHKVLICFFCSLLAVQTFAEPKVNMSFQNEELMKVIEIYSKASGQKFVIDPGVRGKISIMLPGEVSIEEAFNHLSSALAINGYAISKQGDTMVIKMARNIQRDLIEVSTALPKLKPERLYTWIYRAKFIPVESIALELRVLTSKDGEITIHHKTNSLIISDWAANINRVAEILAELDKPVEPSIAKVVESSQKSKSTKQNPSKTDPSKKEDSKE